MELSLSSYILALIAGASSLLSPYALLLLPIPLESARSGFRFSKVALGLGFIIIFTVVGIFSVNIGASNYVNLVLFRQTCASVMMMVAIPLLFFSEGGEKANIHHLLRFDKRYGQFALGVLLGATWSPCIGPEIFSITMASNAQTSIQIASIISLFSLGAIVPLIMLGAFYKKFIMYWREHLRESDFGGMRLFGAILLLMGILIITGLDQSVFHQTNGVSSSSGNDSTFPKIFE